MATPTDLFFSEYVEGSSLNKALEIFNGTGAAVDLSDYVVEIYFNGSESPGATIALSGSLEDGDVFVIADDGADAAILTEADLTPTNNFFNGDDTIVLRRDSAIIDVIGQIGTDPGSEFFNNGVGTQDETLRRISSVMDGDTIGDDAYDPSVEFESFANNAFDGLGAHSIDDGSSEPQDLIISEYVEGTSFNKAIELYNGTDAAIDFDSGAVYTLELYSNGRAEAEGPTATTTLTGMVAANDVFVLANPSAAEGVLDETDQEASGINHNGDDSYLLKKDGVVIDSFGQNGDDPGASWAGGGLSTQNSTLIRKEEITEGDTIIDDAFDPSLEYDGLPTNDFSDLGTHHGGAPPEPPVADPFPIALEAIGTYGSANGAEIVAFDPDTNWAYLTSGDGVEVVNLNDPTSPSQVALIDPALDGASDSAVTSVAVANGVLAAAVPGDDAQAPGSVFFYATATTGFLGSVEVGALPDMLTFDDTGTYVLVANEGEPNDDYDVDPEGSVSVISLNLDDPSASAVDTFAFDESVTKEALLDKGVRVFGPEASGPQDLEPEFITVQGTMAFVALQENNAIAVINDFTTPGAITIDDILPLGTKDHSILGNGFDASNRDDGIAIQPQPTLGLYQPDGIASYTIDGVKYVVTANEGDARDYDGFSEEERVADLDLDPTAHPNAADLQLDENLGRLNSTTVDGDADDDGDVDQIFSYGARSFSIWDEDGVLVYDSGNDFEAITAERTPDFFNANDGDPDEFDNRSDDKGPEPESVVIGEIDDRTFAFIGLERAGGGVMVYDVTDPTAPTFVDYVRNDGDIAPEGLAFIADTDSPTGAPLLLVANEESNTLTTYEISIPPEPSLPEVAIHDIQGPGHVSPFVLDDGETTLEFLGDLPANTFNVVGDRVITTGIVTAVDSNGFFLQDADGDDDIATSDGIFLFDGGDNLVSVGDLLTVEADVAEFFPGDTDTRNLSSTQLINADVTVESSGNALPEIAVIGQGGRLAPTKNIDDDAFAQYDPENDGIDFFESLEGMLVEAEDLVAVAGTNRFGEIFAVTNQGADATGLSDRGTLNVSPDDFNPEKIQINFDDGILDFEFPEVNVGDLLGDVVGVVSYSFGNFEILPTIDFSANVTPADLSPEISALVGSENDLLIASYNVLNLDPNDTDGDTDVADGRFDAIAAQIVANLNAPDIVGLQEVQDNSGSTDDGVTSADMTLQALVDAIANAGGPAYEFIDNTFIGNNTSGGQPGGNIRTAFLFNPDRVGLVDGSVQPIGGQGAGESFSGARLPLTADFMFNGETITVVDNHFSSKGGSAPILGTEQDFGERQEEPDVNGSLNERRVQAQAVNDFVDGVLENDAEANVVVLGDLNEFEFISPLDILAGTSRSTDDGFGLDDGDGAILANLIDGIADDEIYSFIFQGNSQALDHILVSDSLLDAAPEIDIVHVNSEFAETAERASDHDPVLTRLTIPEAPDTFTLQLLHASDLEGGVEAIEDAPNFAAIAEAFEAEYADNTLILSAGDNFLSGPFFSASNDQTVFRDGGVFNEFYNAHFGVSDYDGLREAGGRVDISIMNAIGFDASAVGNHEFDLGSDAFEQIIEEDFRSPDGPAGDRWVGAQFPYLSANLDFTGDGDLADLFTPNILPNTAFQTGPAQSAAGDANVPKIAPATLVDVGGETIGVVGATTQLLQSISSPSGTTVVGPQANDMAALAEILQPVIDQIVDGGVNKIVLVSHLQQFALEQELAGLLSGVDVIVAGGSDTIVADPTDRLRTGDTADVTPYPFETTDADGNPVAIVSTDGQYSYVGRLVVEFDENGDIIPESIDEEESGAFATDDQGVAEAFGIDEADIDAIAFADGTEAKLVQDLVEAARGVVEAKDGNVFGETAVYLDGSRESVRTEETNFGNLSADANLSEAQKFDPTVVLSLKNGGGIRAPIGEIDADGELLPPQANDFKNEGEISQLDIENALKFNNGLTLITLSAEQLLEVVEHSVAATAPGATPGQFAQVGGFAFSFDATQPAGARVQSISLIDEDGNPTDPIVLGGEAIDPTQSFRMVTLDFLAGGGDGYPFADFAAADPDFADVVQLGDVLTEDGVATFANPGSEQDALAEFLSEEHGIDAGTPFSEAEMDPANDARIQNLGVRDDSLDDGFILGTPGSDNLVGTGADETFIMMGGLIDVSNGGGGSDEFQFGSETSNGVFERDYIYGFGADDMLDLGGAAIAREINARFATVLVLEGDGDIVFLPGVVDFDEATQLI